MNKLQQDMWQLAARYSALGIELTTAVVAGTLLGHWADTAWGTSPWGMLVGCAGGVSAAVRGARRLLPRAPPPTPPD